MGALNDWLLFVIVVVPLIVGSILAITEVIGRRPDLPARRRLLWVAALVLVPYVSLLVYAVIRPTRGSARDSTTTESSTGADLDDRLTAIEQHVAGLIDDADYDAVIARTS